MSNVSYEYRGCVPDMAFRDNELQVSSYYTTQMTQPVSETGVTSTALGRSLWDVYQHQSYQPNKKEYTNYLDGPFRLMQSLEEKAETDVLSRMSTEQLVVRCGEKAQRLGHKYFALQGNGHCFSTPDMQFMNPKKHPERTSLAPEYCQPCQSVERCGPAAEPCGKLCQAKHGGEPCPYLTLPQVGACVASDVKLASETDSKRGGYFTNAVYEIVADDEAMFEYNPTKGLSEGGTPYQRVTPPHELLNQSKRQADTKYTDPIPKLGKKLNCIDQNRPLAEEARLKTVAQRYYHPERNKNPVVPRPYYDLKPTQKFWAQYLTPDSSEKSVFFDAAPGYGKTCPATMMLGRFAEAKWNVLWVTKNEKMKEDVEGAIFNEFCDDRIREFLEDPNQAIPDSHPRVYDLNEKMIWVANANRSTINTKLGVKFNKTPENPNRVTYNELVNIITRYNANGKSAYDKFLTRARRLNPGTTDIFYKTLLVVDEAHNLISESFDDGKDLNRIPTRNNGFIYKNKVYRTKGDLYRHLMSPEEASKPIEGRDMIVAALWDSYQSSGSDSAKVVFVTGTPMKNSGSELIFLMNMGQNREELLLPPNVESYVDIQAQTYHDQGVQRFREAARNRFLYIAATKNPDEFPRAMLNIVSVVYPAFLKPMFLDKIRGLRSYEELLKYSRRFALAATVTRFRSLDQLSQQQQQAAAVQISSNAPSAANAPNGLLDRTTFVTLYRNQIKNWIRVAGLEWSNMTPEKRKEIERLYEIASQDNRKPPAFPPQMLSPYNLARFNGQSYELTPEPELNIPPNMDRSRLLVLRKDVFMSYQASYHKWLTQDSAYLPNGQKLTFQEWYDRKEVWRRQVPMAIIGKGDVPSEWLTSHGTLKREEAFVDHMMRLVQKGLYVEPQKQDRHAHLQDAPIQKSKHRPAFDILGRRIKHKQPKHKHGPGQPIEEERVEVRYWALDFKPDRFYKFAQVYMPTLVRLCDLIEANENKFSFEFQRHTKHCVYTNVSRGHIGIGAANTEEAYYSSHLIGSIFKCRSKFYLRKDEKDHPPANRWGVSILGTGVAQVRQSSTTIIKASNEDVFGSRFKVLVLDSTLMEGFSLYDNSFIYLVDLPGTEAELAQTVGRIMRSCRSKNLPFYEGFGPKVEVHVFRHSFADQPSKTLYDYVLDQTDPHQLAELQSVNLFSEMIPSLAADAKYTQNINDFQPIYNGEIIGVDRQTVPNKLFYRIRRRDMIAYDYTTGSNPKAQPATLEFLVDDAHVWTSKPSNMASQADLVPRLQVGTKLNNDRVIGQVQVEGFDEIQNMYQVKRLDGSNGSHEMLPLNDMSLPLGSMIYFAVPSAIEMLSQILNIAKVRAIVRVNRRRKKQSDSMDRERRRTQDAIFDQLKLPEVPEHQLKHGWEGDPIQLLFATMAIQQEMCEFGRDQTVPLTLMIPQAHVFESRPYYETLCIQWRCSEEDPTRNRILVDGQQLLNRMLTETKVGMSMAWLQLVDRECIRGRVPTRHRDHFNILLYSAKYNTLERIEPYGRAVGNWFDMEELDEELGLLAMRYKIKYQPPQQKMIKQVRTTFDHQAFMILYLHCRILYELQDKDKQNAFPSLNYFLDDFLAALQKKIAEHRKVFKDLLESYAVKTKWMIPTVKSWKNYDQTQSFWVNALRYADGLNQHKLEFCESMDPLTMKIKDSAAGWHVPGVDPDPTLAQSIWNTTKVTVSTVAGLIKSIGTHLFSS